MRNNPAHKWGEVCGSLHHLEKEGQEEVYHCLACGKDKLYRNVRSGLWNCFACGISGKVDFGTLPTKRRVQFREHPGFIVTIKTCKPGVVGPFAHWLNRTDVKTLEDFDPVVIQGDGVKTPPRAYLPLVDLQWDTECGYVSYQGPGVYRILGQRGLLKSPVPSDTNYLLITEGLFDCLSLHRAVQGKYLCVCTLGNRISQFQLEQLLLITFGHPIRFVVCYDRDIPFAAHVLRNRLRQYHPTSIQFPPEPYKDWDEAIRGGVEFRIDETS